MNHQIEVNNNVIIITFCHKTNYLISLLYDCWFLFNFFFIQYVFQIKFSFLFARSNQMNTREFKRILKFWMLPDPGSHLMTLKHPSNHIKPHTQHTTSALSLQTFVGAGSTQNVTVHSRRFRGIRACTFLQECTYIDNICVRISVSRVYIYIYFLVPYKRLLVGSACKLVFLYSYHAFNMSMRLLEWVNWTLSWQLKVKGDPSTPMCDRPAIQHVAPGGP